MDTRRGLDNPGVQLRLDALRANNEKLAHVAEEMIATTPETNPGQLIAFIDALVAANNVFKYAEQLEHITNKKHKSESEKK
jgi:hypothetical protein